MSIASFKIFSRTLDGNGTPTDVEVPQDDDSYYQFPTMYEETRFVIKLDGPFEDFGNQYVAYWSYSIGDSGYDFGGTTNTEQEFELDSNMNGLSGYFRVEVELQSDFSSSTETVYCNIDLPPEQNLTVADSGNTIAAWSENGVYLPTTGSLDSSFKITIVNVRTKPITIHTRSSAHIRGWESGYLVNAINLVDDGDSVSLAWDDVFSVWQVIARYAAPPPTNPFITYRTTGTLSASQAQETPISFNNFYDNSPFSGSNVDHPAGYFGADYGGGYGGYGGGYGYGYGYAATTYMPKTDGLYLFSFRIRLEFYGDAQAFNLGLRMYDSTSGDDVHYPRFMVQNDTAYETNSVELTFTHSCVANHKYKFSIFNPSTSFLIGIAQYSSATVVRLSDTY